MKRFTLVLFVVFFAFYGKLNAQTYCTPTWTSANAYNIGTQEVKIGTISNNTTTSYTAPYNVYTNMSTTHYPASTVNVSVKVGSGNNTWFCIYIDFNSDGTFNTSNERVYSSGLIAANAYSTGSFNIPASASAGNKRMRVISGFGD